MESSKTNLPIQLTSFVGREREIAEVTRLLTTTRLLTLTGAGGCGKTRLALEVAARLADSFEHGVAWTELAPLNAPELVPQAVAQVFDVREFTNQPLTQSLKNYLRTQRILLILDNCEHLITACAHLAEELLQACPHFSILATSREALNVPGETAWRVPPLQIPNPKTIKTLEALLSTESARLFVDRAGSTEPTFSANQQNTNAIAQICYRLDGMPLALELAAARIKALPVEQIAVRLDDRFRLLNIGSRTASPRHQTLRAVIDWSYGLLSPTEKMLFRRLAVFIGGWTLEAAEAICSGDGLDWSEILDALARLVDKSLVIAQNEVARYHMLETIRQYAHEKLAEAGEGERTCDHYLDFFFDFVKIVDPKLRGSQEMVWLERLGREHDNLRAAFDWAMRKDDPDMSLKFASRLRWFLWVHGYLREGRELIARAMVRIHNASKPAQAEALLTFGFFMMPQGNYVQVDTDLAKSLALFQELGDEIGAGCARHYLGMSASWQGNFVKADTLLGENLILWRKLGDKWWTAHTLYNLSTSSRNKHDPNTAAGILEEALTIWQEIGNKRGLARTLGALAEVAEQQHDFQRAEKLNVQALAVMLEIGDKWSFAQYLRLASASIASSLGDFERAARLLGAAEALRESIGYQLQPTERSSHEQIVAAIRTELDETEFQTAWNTGRTMTMEQAIALAEAKTVDSPNAHAPSHPSRQAAKEKFGGLTAREREVAALIAQGNSNREIAEAFVLSERTVEGYVGNILNKLDFKVRSQIAAWAVEKGFV